MKASELKIGESCRHEHVGCRRVEPPIKSEKVWLITQEDKIITIDPDVVVWSAFCFEGPDRPEDDRAMSAHIYECIQRTESLSSLDIIDEYREERMKAVAAEILKPDSDEVITDLHTLDYIWRVKGDRSIGGNQVYRRRALDYYLGRTVDHHMCGEGKLLKIDYEYGDKRLPLDHEYFNEGRVWLSDKSKKHNLPSRGIHYGVLVKMPCECGKVKYDMFAIPGVHSGAFAYLVDEESDSYLDLRNHCRVCVDCENRAIPPDAI